MCSLAFVLDVSENTPSEARYMFLQYNELLSEQKVLRKFYLWQDRYPSFGYIQTNLGVLLDTEKTGKIDCSMEDLYFRLIFQGVMAIRGEIIDDYLQ